MKMKPAFALLCVWLCWVSARPQSSATPVPTDPEKLLALLTSHNGLASDPVQPWHIKLSWDQFDGSGDKVHSGTIEEFHAGPRRDRTIYQGDLSNETIVTNDSAIYVDGDNAWPKPAELQVQDEVLRPFRRANYHLRGAKLKSSELTLGSTKMPCVTIAQTDLVEIGTAQYCSDREEPRLRYTHGIGRAQTVYNSFKLFDEKYISTNISVTDGTKPYLSIRIDVLEPCLLPIKDLFDLPPNASLLTGRVQIPSGVLMGEYLIKNDVRGGSLEHGTVKVHFTVGKDGKVAEAVPMGGSPGLQEVIVRNVRSYQFRPFLFGGQAIEVESTMQFNWN